MDTCILTYSGVKGVYQIDPEVGMFEPWPVAAQQRLPMGALVPVLSWAVCVCTSVHQEMEKHSNSQNALTTKRE